MRKVLFVLMFTVLFAGVAAAQDSKDTAQDTPKLSEIQTLKAANWAKSMTILQLQKQSVEQQLKDAAEALQKEQVALEADFVKTLGCKDGWDWQTMGCKKVEPPTAPAVKKEK